jgi:glucose/arabinose dehydrogenase
MRLLRASVLTMLVSVLAPAQQASDQYTISPFWLGGAADPRVLEAVPGNRVFVGCGDGTIRILTDADNNGIAEAAALFVSSVWGPHGLAWKQNGPGYDLFVAHLTAPGGGTGQITLFTDLNGDDIFDVVTTMVMNLPLGAHQVNNIKLDPSQQWLYIAQGATSNSTAGGGACVAKIPVTAQNLVWGTPQIQIVATGLRNPWGIEFLPNGTLFATDNGRDDLGPSDPPDEFNHIVQGGDYGFPAVSGMPPAGNTTRAPIGLFESHSSACGFAIDKGNLLTGFVHQVFVAEWGNWNGLAPTPRGQKIVQGNLHQRSNGTWVLNSWDFLANCGHVLDVDVGPTGALFFSVQWGGPGWLEGVYHVVPTHGTALKMSGLPELGQTIQVSVHSPSRPGHLYKVAASMGTGPIPTALGNLGLTWDDIFVWSLSGNIYLNFAPTGILNAQGIGAGADSVLIPNLPVLSGFTLYLAAATFDPVTIALTSVTPTAHLLML